MHTLCVDKGVVFMFVVSVSKNKIIKMLLTSVVVIALSLALVFLIKCIGDIQASQTISGKSDSAASEGEILTFISNYGWEVDEEPVEVREVVIPETFDDVYNNYNKIQLEQGFNLEKYAGLRVKCRTYIVRNYPNTMPEDDFIRINLLIYDNEIIGGDVCSVKLDGFMHGFSKE